MWLSQECLYGSCWFRSWVHCWTAVSFWKKQLSPVVGDMDEKLIKASLCSLSAPGRNWELKGSFLRKHLSRDLENHIGFVNISFLCTGLPTAQSFLIKCRMSDIFSYMVMHNWKFCHGVNLKRPCVLRPGYY